MIHRALLGSLERFVGVLLEHYGGALPFWLSPTQVAVLPISQKHIKYSASIIDELKKYHIRACLDERNETIGKKIREAELQKLPYILIIGDKEVKSKTVAVRERHKGDIGAKPLKEFLKRLPK